MIANQIADKISDQCTKKRLVTSLEILPSIIRICHTFLELFLRKSIKYEAISCNCPWIIDYILLKPALNKSWICIDDWNSVFRKLMDGSRIASGVCHALMKSILNASFVWPFKFSKIHLTHALRYSIRPATTITRLIPTCEEYLGTLAWNILGTLL